MNSITVEHTPLEGILILTPSVFGDERGSFMEVFNQRHFESATGQDTPFVQDNLSRSKQWTLRGLHYQLPNAQGKLVSVLAGEIFDVVVDLRSNSKTFGQWFGLYLSAHNRQQLWLPEGLAHGFLVTSPQGALVHYKSTHYYDPDSEHCLHWQDPRIDIPWPIPPEIKPIVSPKDACGQTWDAVIKF